MKRLFTLLLIFASLLSKGQNFEWAFGFGSSTNNTHGYGITLDNSNNNISTGEFSGSIDFDPGTGTFTLNNPSQRDCYVLKLDPYGNFIWAIALDGTSRGESIVTDNLNNVYVTGKFSGTVDFDPGTNVYNITSNGGDDIFILKLDSLGNFIWAESIGGTTNDYPQSICMDNSNQIYITGSFNSPSVDFDPSLSGIFNINNNGSSDMFILKIDNNGNFKWAKSIASNGAEFSFDIDNDENGNLYYAGYFNFGTLDFDPGPGTFNLTAPSSTGFVSKLDSSGNFIWAKAFASSGASSPVRDLTLDNNFDLIITGGFNDTIDFDPGPSIYNLVSNGSIDSYILKLDSSGNFIWVKSFGGTGYDDPSSINTDASNNIYLTGSFEGIIDIDPGSGSSNVTSNGLNDIFILKLDSLGNYMWSGSMGSVDTDLGECIIVDNPGNIYSTGKYAGTADFNPGLGTNNLISSGTDYSYVQKIGTPLPEICMVSVDSISQYNIIYWDKSLYTNIDSFHVYRETITNNYVKIASIPFDSLGQFIDTVYYQFFPFTGDPNIATYRYKLQTKDIWGNLSLLSPYHNTIYVNNNVGTFTWNDYQIENQSIPISQLTAYYLYRDDNSTGSWNLISAVAGTQTNITDPNYSSYPFGSWRIETDWSISCDPTRAGVNTSRSNIKNQGAAPTFINEYNQNNISIYPNPSSENIQISGTNGKILLVEIFDITGKKMISLPSSLGEIDVSNLENGIYLIRISSNGNEYWKRFEVIK